MVETVSVEDKTPLGASVSIHRHARCELIESRLLPHRLEVNRDSYRHFAHVFFLAEGRAVVELGDQTTALEAFALVYVPVSSPLTPAPASQSNTTHSNTRFSLRLEPGSSGFLVGVSSELLMESLGAGAESVLLREFSEHLSFVQQTDDTSIEEIYGIVVSLGNELSDPSRGSRMAVAAWVRLLLMSHWRQSGSHDVSEQGHGEISSLLQRFRQLVELHFRERWAVKDYANALAVSHDRLHAICTRTLEKTPSQLIQERVIFEAKLRLERSGHSIQQLAHALGFPDSTAFSHYFKRYTGTTPAAFRKQSQSSQQRRQDSLSFGYADWP
ncbi:MAG: helix-turn-helix domain-containing protein [Oceanospirillales bacterium]|nr:helix-turn-helix domain-containing protein [Oceanospirillales bacterium]